jgi:drug/metabolite transporter (DMT)-like permease
VDISNKDNKKGTVYSLLLFMVLIWGANFIISKFALLYFHPLTIATIRIFFSAMAFLTFIFFTKKGKKIELPDHFRIAILAFFGIILNQLSFIYGLNYTTPSHAALMIATIPIFVFIFAGRFLKEGLLNIKGAGILISFAGVAILSRIWEADFQDSYLLGDILTIFTAISFAIYTVLGKPIVQKYPPLKVTALVYFYGALMMIPLYPIYIIEITRSKAPLSAYLALAYVVFLATFLAYIIYYWALARIDASKVAAFLYLQPLTATVLSVLFGFELISYSLFLGGILIIGGVFLTERG